MVSPHEDGATVEFLQSDITPNAPFDEAILSWNVKHAEGSVLTVEARPKINGRPGPWFSLGTWAPEAGSEVRGSVRNQRTPEGTVRTDILDLATPAQALDLRVALKGPRRAVLDLVSVTFSRGQPTETTSWPRSDVWGRTLEVPERAQGNYPRGNVLCSPTSTSMVLAFWARKTGRPEWDQDVPEVEQRVWDPTYRGAGNWSFNTAYMGSFQGLRSYVARLGGIEDLEAWIRGGIPVICSVSFDLIRSRDLSPEESGHLLVLIGFTQEGDPVFNDPARRDPVRFIYRRSDFERAWNYSNRTVYLTHAENAPVPVSPFARWLGPR
jgi:hypothetical protein